MTLTTEDIVWRQIHWSQPLAPATALSVLRSLAADPTAAQVVFEVRATKAGVHYLVGGRLPVVLSVCRIIRTASPTSRITAPEQARAAVHGAASARLSTRHRPLRTDRLEDTSRALLGALTRVRAGEVLVLQLVLGPRRIPLAVPNQSPASSVAPLWSVVWHGNRGAIDGEKRAALREKVGEHGFACTLRIGVQATDAERRRMLVHAVFGALRTAQSPGVVTRLRRDSERRLSGGDRPLRWHLRLNATEVLAWSAWPLGEDVLPGQPDRHPRLLPPAPNTTGAGRVICHANAPGIEADLAQPVASALRHTHVVGPTGTGKSTLLLNLIRQDVAAGHPVVVVDPQGDLVQDVLGQIPESRARDVVVLDPSDKAAPVGLNPLHGAGRDPEVVADGLLAIFKALYGDGLGPRSTDILHASLLTLTRHPDASLVMLPLLLTNTGFRRSLTATVRDPIALTPFWRWFESISDAERQTATAPLHNKLRPWLLRPSLRNVLGQRRPAISMTEVFEDKKILLVSLAHGQIGPEGAALLGALVVAELWQATIDRARLPVARRHAVMVTLDEFAAFTHVPTDLADALARSRGMGVSYTLAHQFLAQLTPAMRTAVLANTRSRVCFQLAADDAAAIARSTPDLQPIDFTMLPAYSVYAALHAGSHAATYASGQTYPAPKAMSNPATIRALSRKQYGRPLDEIEAEFADLAGIRPTAAGQPNSDNPERPGRARRQTP